MRKRVISQLWAIALSLTAVFGAMGCLVSAFSLDPIGIGTAISWILAAVVFSFCFAYRISLYPTAGLAVNTRSDSGAGSPIVWFPLGGLVLLGVYLWLRGYLSDSLELLVQELFDVYDSAYGWGTLSWSGEDLTGAGTGTALCWLGLPIVISTCYAVLRPSGTALAAVLAALPLVCCMIVTDTVPGLLPLFVLLLSLLLLMITQTVRRRDEEQGSRLLAILALPVAAGLGLLFLLTPQAEYNRQEGAQRLEDMVVSWFEKDFQLPELPKVTQPSLPQITLPPVGTGSAPKRENLMTVGPKVHSDMRIMTVTAEQGAVVYLRGVGYDSYTGTAWSVQAGEELPHWPEEDGQTVPGGRVTVSTAMSHDVLYLPYYVSADTYKAMFGGKLDNTGREKEYTFVQSTLPQTALLSGVGESYGIDMELYLSLPEETSAWAKGVIEDLFGTDTPPLTAATAYAIAEYVRSSAEYDLSTPRMDSDSADFARWFLTESDTGYCIHFASATAVLLRAAGIPSRYVTGYTVFAPAGQETVVTGRHAHAWAEFRLPDKPWYPLESTPDDQEEVPLPTLPSLPEATEPTASHEPSEPSETLPTGEPEETRPDAVQPPPDGGEPPRDSGAVWPWILGALLCAGVVAQWRIRVGLRRGRQSRGRSKQKALARWQHHALLARVLKQSPDRELLQIAQKAKFSQHAVTAEELAAFSKVIQTQTRELKKKPFYLRLYYTLILALY